MEKNWLIRTKSNHILGPVSKEKVLELYLNGSIQPDDEICSGNGYWFYIREKELVEKFLLGSESQGFNPLSEAFQTPAIPNQVNPATKTDGTILAKSDHQSDTREISDEIPKEVSQNFTHQISKTIKTKKESLGPKKLNVKKDVEQSQDYPGQIEENSGAKQLWIKYLGIIGFILLFLLIYFRKTILNNFFKMNAVSAQISIISTASAEEKIKKKVFSVATFNMTKFPLDHQLG
jgi:hypothetical protein